MYSFRNLPSILSGYLCFKVNFVKQGRQGTVMTGMEILLAYVWILVLSVFGFALEWLKHTLETQAEMSHCHSPEAPPTNADAILFHNSFPLRKGFERNSLIIAFFLCRNCLCYYFYFQIPLPFSSLPQSCFLYRMLFLSISYNYEMLLPVTFSSRLHLLLSSDLKFK